MSAYYYTIIIATIFATAANVTNHSGLTSKRSYPILTKVLLLLCGMTLIFTAGLRYYVGTDYGGYYKGLITYANRFDVAVKELDEPMLPIIARVVGWFSNDGAYFIFVCSLITISLILYQNYKNTDSFVFCTLLFVFIGVWHGSFNGVRQYFAAAIIFAGHRLILDKKFWKYLLVVFMAFCFHRSSIIMLIPFFIYRNRITFRNVLLLLIGAYIISANYDTVFSFVGFLKDSEMSMGDTAYSSTTVNIFRVLTFCAPAITVLVLYWKKNPDSEQTFYINALLANAAAMLATSNSAYLARLSIYTNVFTPLALSKLLKFENKIVEVTVKCLVVILYAIFWYIDISGSLALAEFHWIWER